MFRTFVRTVVGIPDSSICSADVNCLSSSVPLLTNQRTGLIDPDTPSSAMTKTSNDGKKLQLVVCTLLAVYKLLLTVLVL